MIIKSLEDLEVFQLARSYADEMSAIASRPCMRKDDELQKQMLDCSASVGVRIAEGFGQGTDRRKYITAAEHSDLTSKYSVLGKKLSSWIGHLAREDRKQRG
jgi:23S rRNA-intervening sequence protein